MINKKDVVKIKEHKNYKRNGLNNTEVIEELNAEELFDNDYKLAINSFINKDYKDENNKPYFKERDYTAFNMYDNDEYEDNEERFEFNEKGKLIKIDNKDAWYESVKEEIKIKQRNEYINNKLKYEYNNIDLIDNKSNYKEEYEDNFYGEEALMFNLNEDLDYNEKQEKKSTILNRKKQLINVLKDNEETIAQAIIRLKNNYENCDNNLGVSKDNKKCNILSNGKRIRKNNIYSNNNKQEITNTNNANKYNNNSNLLLKNKYHNLLTIISELVSLGETDVYNLTKEDLEVYTKRQEKIIKENNTKNNEETQQS